MEVIINNQEELDVFNNATGSKITVSELINIISKLDSENEVLLKIRR